MAPMGTNFKGTYQVQCVIGEKESVEAALRRFRREVMSSECINEVRRRRYFEDAQDIKKRKEKKAHKLRARSRKNQSHIRIPKN